MGQIPRLPAMLALLSLLAFTGSGCDDDPAVPYDPEPPAAPRGFTSVTGDGEVLLLWYANEEWDLSGYRIYRSERSDGPYQRLVQVPARRTEYTDNQVRNGKTYYYGITAVDDAGNESAFSPEAVYDTPRPAGRGVRMRNYYDDPRRCAYDFSKFRITDYDDPDADIAFLYDGETGGWIYGLEWPPGSGVYTEVQDAGYRQMDDVGWAPPAGWSPSATVEVVEGHVYVIWTRDDHYAKLRVVEAHPDEITIDWAYQIDPGNQELREPPSGAGGDGGPPRPVRRIRLGLREAAPPGR